MIGRGQFLALGALVALCGCSSEPSAISEPSFPEAPLATFDSGRFVVNVVDMPIKCPVAPLEFCFLADWYFTERGVRRLNGAFPALTLLRLP